MSDTRTSPAAPDPDLASRLAAVERLLREQPPGAAGDDAARLARALAELEEAVSRATDVTRRDARRLDAVRAQCALRIRQVPDGVLDGLYEAVRARAVGDADPQASAWRRAGMSSAFLDAPRSLVMWRRAALAACVLLAVGVGLLTTSGTGPAAPVDGPEPAPLVRYDPRDDVLRRLEPEDELDRASDPRVRDVRYEAERIRRRPRFFSFSVRPRLEWDAGRFLDAIPVLRLRAPAATDALEQN